MKRISQLQIDFVRYRKLMMAISLTLMAVSIICILTLGINLGLDFSGGVLVELHFSAAVVPEQIKQLLVDGGIDGAVVQLFGSSQDILIRLQESGHQGLSDQVFTIIQTGFHDVELRRVEFVGAQVGGELRDQGGFGLLVALAVVLVYVTFRFQLKFAIGSVLALVHDVVIILGIFSLFQFDFDLSVLAALLAIIGYSLNDSIVVSDRVRENFFKRNLKNLEQIINISLNEVLDRTIVTSLTTLLVIIALLVFGGEAMRSFAIALCIGVVVGTYSSIYVVCNTLFMLLLTRDDMLVEEADASKKEVV